MVTRQTHFEEQDCAAFQSDGRNRNIFPQLLDRQAPTISEDSNICNGRNLMDLLGAAKETDHQGQRLSLTLGSCIPSHVLDPSFHYRQRSNLVGSGYLIAGEEAREVCSPGGEQMRNDYSFIDNTYVSSSTSQNQSCSTSYETESFAANVGNSRYLKPAQSLLEEVVSVHGKAIEIGIDKSIGRLARSSRQGALRISPELKAGICSSPEKHQLQIRISKLVALLDEVESRYEQYCHQMEEVVLSFEVIAGQGAAKSYTALALQAMSRHFRSLRDAIIDQINAAKRQVSQDIPRIHTSLSQLSLFDQEIRHNQVSLQQLGMMQNQRQVWRSMRGLPENSVAFLRSWLFEHFLHPYPKDSEKLMLASQTGLTKNQVSNWFINARVRLWKPMIEEMYKEEVAESSMESNPSSEKE